MHRSRNPINKVKRITLRPAGEGAVSNVHMMEWNCCTGVTVTCCMELKNVSISFFISQTEFFFCFCFFYQSLSNQLVNNANEWCNGIAEVILPHVQQMAWIHKETFGGSADCDVMKPSMWPPREPGTCQLPVTSISSYMSAKQLEIY